MKAIEVVHGSLRTTYGEAVRHGGFEFVPADVQLNGHSFSLDFRLRDYVGDQAPSVVRIPVRHQFDAAWVFARIPKAFGMVSPPSEEEKSLVYQGFIAVAEGERAGYPFICTDHYGRSSLMFSAEGPGEPLRSSIASAFWGLLLQSAEELEDFEHRVYHLGAGVWLEYGCKFGHVYCEQSPG
jgi:hypothetical protein